MLDWPHTIPYDLYEALETAEHDAWLAAFCSWTKVHRLRLKLHW